MKNYLENTTLPLIKMSFCPPSARLAEAALQMLKAAAHCCCLVQGFWEAAGGCALSQGSGPVWQGGFCSWCGDSKHCTHGSVSDPQPSSAVCVQQAHQNLQQATEVLVFWQSQPSHQGCAVSALPQPPLNSPQPFCPTPPVTPL